MVEDEKKYLNGVFQKNTLIIFDESHKLKGKTSLNSKLGIFAKEQGYKILMASATSAINPMDMRAMGYILGLHNNTSFWSWVRRNGCYQGRFGYTFNGDKEILRNLHKDVFLDRGIRLRRDEIPGFLNVMFIVSHTIWIKLILNRLLKCSLK